MKEKRSIIQPILAKTQRQYKVAISEIGYQDQWQESLLACVTVSNDARYTQSLLQKVYQTIQNNNPYIVIVEHKIEIV